MNERPACTLPITVSYEYVTNSWGVHCACGFEVFGLSSQEAVDDTIAWHQGHPSLLGDDL